eukprot:g9748.t1
MRAVSSPQRPPPLVSPPPLAHALSGAVGAVVAMALLYPLDQVRAILQVDDELAKECAAPGGAGVLGALSRIVRRHGKAGLWRGMVPVLLTMGVSNFVYFYCFNGMKAALLARRRRLNARAATSVAGAAKVAAAAAAGAGGARIASSVLGNEPSSGGRGGGGGGGGAGRGGGGLTPLESVVASTIAGVVNVMATTPLWVSNLRIKAGNGVGGLFSTLASIGRHEGRAGLWSGAAPSLVLVSNPIIQFVVYEALKQAAGRRHSLRHHPQHPSPSMPRGPPSAASADGGRRGGGQGGPAARSPVGLPSHEAFLLGATAKAISTLVTYPLQLAQAKMRAGRARDEGGRCRLTDSPYPPHGGGGAAAARSARRSGVAWQVLTCWTGTLDVLTKVCRENGVGGMYQGMRAKLLHTVLTSALLFLGYERLLEVVASTMAAKSVTLPPPTSSPAAASVRARVSNPTNGSAVVS